VKVIVLMTMPEPLGKQKQAMMSTLHAVKASFTEPDTLSIVTALCHGPLSHFPQMTKEDRDTLQLFLTFVRNLLWIPDAIDHEQSLGRSHFGTLQVPSCRLLALLCAQVLPSPYNSALPCQIAF
jgi:Timeless protein